MYTSLTFYWILCFVITITATFERKNRFNVFPDENLHHIKTHELKRPCCEHEIKSKDHQIKNYQGIPLDILMELNQVTNVSELFWKFMPHVNMSEALRYEITNDEQKETVVPQPATCTTENQTVSLRDDENPYLYYSPPCTRVKRCGGCCGNDLVSCQPTEVEIINFEVSIFQYNETFTFKEKKIVSVEQHVKCKCDCIVKEQDCKDSQVYDARECRCFCNNLEDQDKCDEEPDTKMWNSEICACQCIDVKECTTGSKFNYNTCQCDSQID